MLPQALPETEILLETARVVFAVASDPEQPMTVANIAIQSGLTNEAVLQVLNSHEFLEAMTREFRTITGLALRRGITRLTDIVSKGGDREAVAAHRGLLETYKTFATTADPQDAAAALVRLRQRMEAVRSNLRITHESSRTAPDRQDPPEEGPN